MRKESWNNGNVLLYIGFKKKISKNFDLRKKSKLFEHLPANGEIFSNFDLATPKRKISKFRFVSQNGRIPNFDLRKKVKIFEL